MVAGKAPPRRKRRRGHHVRAVFAFQEVPALGSVLVVATSPDPSERFAEHVSRNLDDGCAVAFGEHVALEHDELAPATRLEVVCRVAFADLAGYS